MCAMVHECFIAKYNDFTEDAKYTASLFCDLAESSNSVHIVIDGVDEIDEPVRNILLETILGVMKSHSNMKLLLSSRPERDVEAKLNADFHILRVHHNNESDIEHYVQNEGHAWTLELQDCGADADSCAQIREALGTVTQLAKGELKYRASCIFHY
jgi:hypothetical protein